MSDSIRQLDVWVWQRLPALNDEIERSSSAHIDSLLDEAYELVRHVDISQLTNIDPKELAIVIGNIGMIIASCARFGASCSDKRIVDMLRRASYLSIRAEHPPRDSLYTYVLWNGKADGSTRAFTKHPFEYEFIRTSRSALVQFEIAANACRDLDLTGDDASLRLGRAHEAILAVAAAYRSLFRTGFTAEHRRWFRESYKPFFCSLEIDGVMWEAPSGANAASVLELDLILGNTDEKYRNHITNRLRYLTANDRRRVLNALTSSSLAQKLERTPDVVDDVMMRIGTLIISLAQASAVHWGLIRGYLHGEEAALDAAKESKNVMSYADVRHVLELRRHNALSESLTRRLDARQRQKAP